MTSITTCITLQKFELNIHLGWPDNERLVKQSVFLDMQLFFPEPPHACITDDLKDTFSYETLCYLIEEKLSEKSFRLLEHLGYDIYHLVKNALPKNMGVNVCITKKPPIQHLTGGVSFSYGESR